MRPTLLVLLLVLAPTALAAPITFDAPVVLQGDDASVRSSAVLLAFRPGTAWSLQAASDDVHDVVVHRYMARPGITSDDGMYIPVDKRTEQSDWRQLNLRSAGEMATLVVYADSVTASAEVLDAVLHERGGFATQAWDDAWWLSAVRGDLEMHGWVPSLEATRPTETITFTGLKSMEWTNAAASCDGTCPRPDGSGLFLEHFEQFLGNGTATLTGAADFVAFLGPLDLSFQGTARLPGAVGSLDCPNCTVEDDTLTVHGDIQLRNVSFVDRRLSADMGGSYSVRVGEVPTGFVSSPAAVAATVAVLAGLALLVKVLAALISKQILADPLEQETRRRVFEAIEANPAVTRTELVRSTGIKNGQMVHHERVLVETGQVQVWKFRCVSHYALPEVDRDEAMRRRMREDPELAQVLDFVSAGGRVPQRDVVRWAGARFGWAASTAQERMHLLLDVGLLAREREGRGCWISPLAASAGSTP